MTMKYILALILLIPSLAQAVEWQCDFKGTRAGRVGSVIWAYCFGIEGDAVKVRQRVLLPSSVTVEAIADAKQWVLSGTPNLFARPADQAIWDSPTVASARQEMADAIKAEVSAGTVPVPPRWRVAPNPSSTTIPPTRPMWDSAVAKSVTERAYVGDLCDCSTKVAKGTQTLCTLRPFGDLPPTSNRTACELK